MAKHTEGPWLGLLGFGGGDYDCLGIIKTEEEIAEKRHEAQEATDGNVYVIVVPLSQAIAAPDMFEALEERVEVACRRTCDKDAGLHTEECDKARAAIAKASGEEK